MANRFNPTVLLGGITIAYRQGMPSQKELAEIVARHKRRTKCYLPETIPRLSLCLEAIGKAFGDIVDSNPGLALLLTVHVGQLYRSGRPWDDEMRVLLLKKRRDILAAMGYGNQQRRVRLLSKISPETPPQAIRELVALDACEGLPKWSCHLAHFSPMAVEIVCLARNKLSLPFLMDVGELDGESARELVKWFKTYGRLYALNDKLYPLKSLADWRQRRGRVEILCQESLSDDIRFPMAPFAGTRDGAIASLCSVGELREIAEEFKNCAMQYAIPAIEGRMCFYKLSDEFSGAPVLIMLEKRSHAKWRLSARAEPFNHAVKPNAAAFIHDWHVTRKVFGNDLPLDLETWIPNLERRFFFRCLGDDLRSAFKEAAFIPEAEAVLQKAGLPSLGMKGQTCMLDGQLVLLYRVDKDEAERNFPAGAALMAYVDGQWRMRSFAWGDAPDWDKDLLFFSLRSHEMGMLGRRQAKGRHIFQGVEMGAMSTDWQSVLPLMFHCPSTEADNSSPFTLGSGCVYHLSLDETCRLGASLYLPTQMFVEKMLAGGGLALAVELPDEMAVFLVSFRRSGNYIVDVAASDNGAIGAPPTAAAWRLALDYLEAKVLWR